MIDDSSRIDPSAVIADDVTIGPFCRIGADVVIGSGSVLHSHIVIEGPCVIGTNNRIFPFAVIGVDSQDKKYAATHRSKTAVHIGNHNIIREGVTIHRGTVQDNRSTRIGDHNLLMAYVHVAHDCVIDNHTTLVNNVTLAGHVRIHDYATIGGYTLINQKRLIGSHSYIGMGAKINHDILPCMVYTEVPGEGLRLRNPNSIGLKRHGVSVDTIRVLKKIATLFQNTDISTTTCITRATECLHTEHSPYAALFADFFAQHARTQHTLAR